jgi:hypothetical protein
LSHRFADFLRLGQAQLLFLREALEDGRGIQKLQRLGLAPEAGSLGETTGEKLNIWKSLEMDI